MAWAFTVERALAEVDAERYNTLFMHTMAEPPEFIDAASVLAFEVRRLRDRVTELEKAHEVQEARAPLWPTDHVGVAQDYLAQALHARGRSFRQGQPDQPAGEVGASEEVQVGESKMRNITDHVVAGDSANHQLSIEVLDEPGAGGANHLYMVKGFNTGTNASDPFRSRGPHGRAGAASEHATVLFQNGPIKEYGVNGVTQEALLAIVIDRLHSFQAGPFSCRENAIALTHCEDALMWLQRRTVKRIKRGVEGQYIA